MSTNQTKVEWHSPHDALPEKERVVWCVREWIPRHQGSDLKSRSECVLAMRFSDRPLSIHDDDPAKDSTWIGLGRKDGCQWSDTTVKSWGYVIDPNGAMA